MLIIKYYLFSIDRTAFQTQTVLILFYYHDLRWLVNKRIEGTCFAIQKFKLFVSAWVFAQNKNPLILC
ncbi:hypothetical protein pgond44_00760 [Psychroflexus gondwanensis ACAM 44]|jgi:hypothetical protein|uniref:Uncharacterized protein n=1 Tax=Psychroflexus gondwanensis ACAM 44 TaxID=1189619 RepID=N1WUB6_9FLAO|nr:hypothetical protein pgond44_00760 [Psychroflexus gondwanensis ACAM 44]